MLIEKKLLINNKNIMLNCKGCWMLKIDIKSKCACNVKKFDDKKLSKKTKEEKAPKPVKKVSEKRKERLKTNWTEGDLFKNIYRKLCKKWMHECIICSELVDEDDVLPACFPHILPKGKFPAYRYFENNVWFVCWIEHHDKFDLAVNNFKQDKGLLELENIIKNWDTPDLTNYIND